MRKTSGGETAEPGENREALIVLTPSLNTSWHLVGYEYI